MKNIKKNEKKDKKYHVELVALIAIEKLQYFWMENILHFPFFPSLVNRRRRRQETRCRSWIS